MRAEGTWKMVQGAEGNQRGGYGGRREEGVRGRKE